MIIFMRKDKIESSLYLWGGNKKWVIVRIEFDIYFFFDKIEFDIWHLDEIWGVIIFPKMKTNNHCATPHRHTCLCLLMELELMFSAKW